jgi:hypothetical protein
VELTEGSLAVEVAWPDDCKSLTRGSQCWGWWYAPWTRTKWAFAIALLSIAGCCGVVRSFWKMSSLASPIESPIELYMFE